MKQGIRRKRMVVVLCLMLAMLLQACAGGGGGTNKPQENPSNTGNSKPEPVAEQPAEEAKLDPYEVSIVYFGKPQRDDALIEGKMNEFFKEKINATVKLMPIASSEYKQRTELMMNSGEHMDLVFTASWLDFFSNVTKGAFIELDELVEQHGQGIKENLHPLYLEAPRFKGKLYAVPTNKEITQSKAFAYRKDIVEKYNVPIDQINNMDDLEPWLQIIKDQEPGIYPLFLSGGGGDSTMYETRSNYRPIGPVPAKTALFLFDYTATGAVEIKSVLDPEIVDINKKELETSRKYYEKGFMNGDAATSKDSINDISKQGKVWFQRPTWKPGTDVELSLMTDSKYEFVTHVLDEPLVTTELTTGSMFSISRTSKDPARAMMVLNYLHTDPYLINLFVNGIEDMHYKKVGDNRIEPISDSGYNPGLSWVVGNQMLNYLKPGQPDDMYINWIQYNNESKRSPLLGFVFDDTSVKNEIAQLTSIATEYRAITTGGISKPIELLDERNKKFEAAGIEKVRAELQSQVEAWQASKK